MGAVKLLLKVFRLHRGEILLDGGLANHLSFVDRSGEIDVRGLPVILGQEGVSLVLLELVVKGLSQRHVTQG